MVCTDDAVFWVGEFKGIDISANTGLKKARYTHQVKAKRRRVSHVVTLGPLTSLPKECIKA
jgi:hypothetical protein